MTIHRVHLSTQLHLRVAFFLTEMGCFLSTSPFSAPTLGSWTSRRPGRMQLQRALSQALGGAAPSLRASPALSTLHSANLAVSRPWFSGSSTGFGTLQGRVDASCCLCSPCCSTATDSLLAGVTRSAMWLKNRRNERGFNNRDAVRLMILNLGNKRRWE